MKLRKIFLLLIFIFSIVLTNIFYSRNIPPLFEYKNRQNIVVLTDTNSNSQEIIPLEFSINDNHLVIENSKDIIPVNIFGVISIVLMIIKTQEKNFKPRKERGLNGIIFWDRKRVLLN